MARTFGRIYVGGVISLLVDYGSTVCSVRSQCGMVVVTMRFDIVDSGGFQVIGCSFERCSCTQGYIVQMLEVNRNNVRTKAKISSRLDHHPTTNTNQQITAF